MGVAHHLAIIGDIALARAIGPKICSYHFVYLLKAHMNSNGMTLWPNRMKMLG